MLIHALDIETDTSDDGLDPRRSWIRSVSVWSNDGSFVVETSRRGREPALLETLADWVGNLPAGVIATWNGAGFDLPFLVDRCRHLGLDQIAEQVVLHADETRTPKYGPLPGHRYGYRASSVFGHRHVDISFVWQAYAEQQLVSWSLKPVARHLGLSPVTVERERIHTLTGAELVAYNLSDVETTHQLTVAALERNFDLDIDTETDRT